MRIKKMDMAVATTDKIELMKTFVRIVEAGSLSAAAQQIGTTQPTISRRLKQLEHYVGGRLFNRTTHHLKLTEIGEKYYLGAVELLANWDAFEAGVVGSASEPTGRLRVIVPHAFGQDTLIEPLTEFMALHPKLNVEWLLHDDRSILDFVTNDIDCAIQVGDNIDDNMVAIRIAEVPRIAVAKPGLIEDLASVNEEPQKLTRYPWLALQTFYRYQVEFHHHQGKPSQTVAMVPRFYTDSLYALRSAAVNGLGVGVGSQWLLERDIQQGRLINILPSWNAAPLPVYLIYPYAKFYPAKLTTFVQFMRQRISQSLNTVTQITN